MNQLKPITDQVKRDVYVQAFGQPFDSKRRKHHALPLDVAFQVAMQKLNGGAL